MKIGIRLNIVLVTLSIFSIASVGITQLLISRGNISELARENALNSARQLASDMTAFLEIYYCLLRLLRTGSPLIQMQTKTFACGIA